MSERSLDLYKSYVQSKNATTRSRSQAIIKVDSNYSISSSFDNNANTNNNSNHKPNPVTNTSNTSMYRPPEWKQFCGPDYSKFFNLDDLNSHPFKYLAEKNLSVYLNFLNVGYGGPRQPVEKNIQIYEQFCK